MTNVLTECGLNDEQAQALIIELRKMAESGWTVGMMVAYTKLPTVVIKYVLSTNRIRILPAR